MAMDRLRESSDPSVVQQMTYYSLKYRQSALSEELGKLSDEQEALLNRANARLNRPISEITIRRLAPALGFFLALLVEEHKALFGFGNRNPAESPDFTHYIPLQEKFLASLSPGYFERQAALYEKASEYTPRGKQIYPRDFIRKAPAVDNSERAFQVLMAEESHPRSQRKKQPQRVAPAKPSTPEPELLIPLPIAPKGPSELALKVAQAFTTPAPLAWHSRVRRWLNLNPSRVEEVRAFTDRRDGQIVRLYEARSESELLEQLTHHGYSPLVERILNSPELQEKYCLKTEGGLALFVELIYPSKRVERGVLSLGIDGKLCYHRKIDPKEKSSFLTFPLAQLAEVNLSDHEPSEADKQQLAEELASGFIGDELQIDERFEILKVIDRKNGCQLNIMPLK
jgi:hypothetical protein